MWDVAGEKQPRRLLGKEAGHSPLACISQRQDDSDGGRQEKVIVLWDTAKAARDTSGGDGEGIAHRVELRR